MTEIQTFCFYCKKLTETESIKNELHTETETYHQITLYKCSICKKTTAFNMTGGIQLLKAEKEK